MCAATVSHFRMETALHVLTINTAREHNCVVLTVDPSDSLLYSSPSFSLQQGLPTSILDRIAWVRRGHAWQVLYYKKGFHFKRTSEHIPKFEYMEPTRVSHHMCGSQMLSFLITPRAHTRAEVM